MKTEMRKGTIVRSLIDGEFYRIVSVGDEALMFSRLNCEEQDGKAVYTEVGDLISVAAKAAGDIFYVVEQPAPERPADEEFKIEGGMFLQKDRQIETGTLVPVEIKALIPGAVILTVKSRTEGKLDLFHYDVEEDKFRKLTEGKDDLQLVYRRGFVTGFVVTERTISFVRCDEEEGNTDPDVSYWKPEETVKQSVRYYYGSHRLFATDPEEGSAVVGDKLPEVILRDVNTDLQIFADSNAYALVEDKDGNYVEVRDPKNDGKRTKATMIYLTYEDENQSPIVKKREVDFPGVIGKVLPCDDEDGNVVFVTNGPEGIVHSNLGHFPRRAVGKEVSVAVDQYPIPIALTFEDDRICTFTFANANYEVCKIRVVKTFDRGFVTTIEEIK